MVRSLSFHLWPVCQSVKLQPHAQKAGGPHSEDTSPKPLAASYVWLGVGSSELPIKSLYNTIPSKKSYPHCKGPRPHIQEQVTGGYEQNYMLFLVLLVFFFTSRINYLNYFIARERDICHLFFLLKILSYFFKIMFLCSWANGATLPPDTVTTQAAKPPSAPSFLPWELSFWWLRNFVWMRENAWRWACTHLSSTIILLPRTKLEVVSQRETGIKIRTYAFHMKPCLKPFEWLFECFLNSLYLCKKVNKK